MADIYLRIKNITVVEVEQLVYLKALYRCDLLFLEEEPKALISTFEDVTIEAELDRSTICITRDKLLQEEGSLLLHS